MAVRLTASQDSGGWRLTTDIAVGLPAQCVGVNEVEQAAVCGAADVVMSMATVYPGIAPLISVRHRGDRRPCRSPDVDVHRGVVGRRPAAHRCHARPGQNWLSGLRRGSRSAEPEAGAFGDFMCLCCTSRSPANSVV